MALRPYIVGNWKMNGLRATLAEARAIDRAAARYPAVDVGIAPPFTLVHTMAEEAQAMAVGGQDVHAKASGAYTGDISAVMLEDAGARFTIVGHSERRSLHGESNADVQAKAVAARAAGLSVILCVGKPKQSVMPVRQNRWCPPSFTARCPQVMPKGWPWPMSRSGPSARGAYPRLRMWPRCIRRSAVT
jgi:triosephosphate isomerase